MFKEDLHSKKTSLPDHEKERLSRRKFMGYAGGAALLAVTAAGCTRDSMSVSTPPVTTADGVDLGSGDIGILNYAYALEQLEAAFYTQVVMSKYGGINALESELITDVRDHEIAHREFFKTALAGKAIGKLEFDFSSINFASRESVLKTSKAFEDLGVSAYNGAGRLLKNVDYLLIAGKIVSVEARHAAFFRDIIQFGSFTDEVVNSSGLDTSRKPAEVLRIASTYIKTKIDASHLPTY